VLGYSVVIGKVEFPFGRSKLIDVEIWIERGQGEIEGQKTDMMATRSSQRYSFAVGLDEPAGDCGDRFKSSLMEGLGKGIEKRKSMNRRKLVSFCFFRFRLYIGSLPQIGRDDC